MCHLRQTANTLICQTDMPLFVANPIVSHHLTQEITPWWKTRCGTLLLLGGILLLSAALRFYDIGKPSFWIGELLSTEQTTGMGLAHEQLPAERFLPAPHAATALRGSAPWWRIWISLDGDTQPPLYLIVLRIWREVFGEGDVSARALSAIISSLAVALLFFVAKPLHGPTAALWACALMALAGPQIEFAQEVGSFAMVGALGLAMVAVLVRIEKRGATPPRLIAVGIFALAALLTHYSAGGALLAAVAYALIRLRGRARWRTAAVLLLSVIGFLAVWGPYLIGQMPGLPGVISDSSDQTVSGALLRWARLPVHLFVNGEIEPAAIALWSCILYLLPFALLRRRPDLLLWALWLLATTLPLALIDARYSTSLIGSMQYTLLAAPAAYVLVAAFLADQPGYRRHAIALILALCCTLTLPDAYVRWKEDWRGFAQYVASRCKPGDVMILYRKQDSDLNANAIYLALSHYLPQGDGNGSFEVPIVVVHGPVPYALLQRINTARRVWVVNPELQSVAGDIFPGGRMSEVERFPIWPFPATVARIEPTPFGIPFLR